MNNDIVEVDLDDIETNDNQTIHEKIEEFVIEYVRLTMDNDYEVPVMSPPIIRAYGSPNCMAINIGACIADMDTKHMVPPRIAININFAKIRMPLVKNYFTHPLVIVSKDNRTCHKKMIDMFEFPKLSDIAHIIHCSVLSSF